MDEAVLTEPRLQPRRHDCRRSSSQDLRRPGAVTGIVGVPVPVGVGATVGVLVGVAVGV